MLAWAAPISIGALTVFDWLARFYRSYDIDKMEGDHFPARWIAWGTIRCLNRNYSNHDFRYFILRLPSYEWTLDFTRNEYRWLQRCLWWFEPSGWRMTRVEPLHGQ